MSNMIPTTPIPVGTRVELHPGTDDWMRGDRFGVVVAIGQMRNGTHTADVKMDRSGRTRRYPTHRLTVHAQERAARYLYECVRPDCEVKRVPGSDMCAQHTTMYHPAPFHTPTR